MYLSRPLYYGIFVGPMFFIMLGMLAISCICQEELHGRRVHLVPLSILTQNPECLFRTPVFELHGGCSKLLAAQFPIRVCVYKRTTFSGSPYIAHTLLAVKEPTM